MTRRGARAAAAVAIGAGVAALGATIAWPPHPRLVWNVSASAPRGLYLVTPGAPIGPGDMVVARPPDHARGVAASRDYLPAGVPLVKRVAAVAGSQVCALGPRLFIEGAWAADRRRRDDRGRPLPWWDGCVRLRSGELLLLMPGNPRSFDGRYFGVSDGGDVIGKARLLWAR